MHEIINFLSIIDPKPRRLSLANTMATPQSHHMKRNRFPFAKVLNFTEDKFDLFPGWLTERQDFVDFMYQKYEKKLLSIPKICEKQERASDERYFISLYLEKIEIFKGLPPIIMDIILDKLGVKYYKTNETIHE